jgi:hypothetical protein
MSEFETPLGAYLKKRGPSQISSKVVFETKGIDAFVQILRKRLKVALVISEKKETVQMILYHCLSEYLFLGRNLFNQGLGCIMSGNGHHLIHQVFIVSSAHFVRLASFALDGENESVSDILKEAKSLMWRPSRRFWQSI